MGTLEKILEEIEEKKKGCLDAIKIEVDPIEITIHREQYKGMRKAENVIRKYLNDGWIPVERELPPNAKYKGALCSRYQLDTKYGVTEGWYNPDLESWFVLAWFMTERCLDSEMDFKRGAHPKIVRCENEVNEKHRIVLAWRPLPEHAAWRRSETHDLR